MNAILKWETDGGYLVDKVESLGEIIFLNKVIERFIETENKHFIVAGKGIGKTLILNYKRSLLQKREFDSGLIFIPKDRPYTEIKDKFPILNKNLISFFSNLDNCRTYWGIALMFSALTHYYSGKSAQETVEFQKLFQKFVDDCMNLTFSKIKALNPLYIFCELLALDYRELIKVQNQYLNSLDLLLSNIQSGIVFFIDSVDQALRDYKKELWINIQTGLLEAAWNIMRKNPHIKIYLTLRYEAYNNYNSDKKEAISGQVSEIMYSQSDIAAILKKLTRVYEAKDTFHDFVGLDTVANIAKESEDSFQYIYRHTLGRPRDLVSICSKLSDKGSLNEINFKTIVNSVAGDIVPSFFEEVKVFLKALGSKEKRERFFSLIPTNILTLDELKLICSHFHTSSGCNNNCKSCESDHPFCELYNVGLLGVISHNWATNEDSQTFLPLYNLQLELKKSLPINTDFYFIHPSLQDYLKKCKNHLYDRNLIPIIAVGNGRIWTTEHTSLIYDWKEKYKESMKDKFVLVNKYMQGVY